MDRYNKDVAYGMVLARGGGNSWSAISSQYGLSPATCKRHVSRWIKNEQYKPQEEKGE